MLQRVVELLHRCIVPSFLVCSNRCIVIELCLLGPPRRGNITLYLPYHLRGQFSLAILHVSEGKEITGIHWIHLVIWYLRRSLFHRFEHGWLIPLLVVRHRRTKVISTCS